MSNPEQSEAGITDINTDKENNVLNNETIKHNKRNKSKKIISIVIVVIIIISVIFGLGYFTDIFMQKAEAPSWKVGDTWVYNSSYNGDTINGSDIGIYVTDKTTFKENRFYQIWGNIDPMFDKRFISAKTLNPIVLVDFKNGTFSETDRPYDFPLYEGKTWDFTTQRNRTYKYIVESSEDVRVLGKTYYAYKIRKTEGNNTKRITYYSPEIKNVVKMINYYEDSQNYILYQFRSFTNEPFERLIETQHLNNKYNATLEVWEERGSPVDDWFTGYRVKYSKDGLEYTGYFTPEEKYHYDWIINNTKEDDKILCWWDYGHDIRGYTGRDVVIDGPSILGAEYIVEPWDIKNWNKESDVFNVTKALVGTPKDTMEVMKQYNATLVYLKARELALTASNVGIFSAIVDSSQRDLDDYYEILARTSSGKIINLNEYQYDPSDEVVNYWIEFKDAYYDSMMYKARFGYSPKDVLLNDEMGNLPAISGGLYMLPIKPCWNQTNFKVIFRTAWWNPFSKEEYGYHPNAWERCEYLDAVEKLENNEGTSAISGSSNLRSGNILLRYFEGAILQGKITDGNGTPIVGVNITVRDEYDVPHQINRTDEAGNYSLIVPFGNITITISEGELDRTILVGDILLETNITVELYQALREDVDMDGNDIPDYYIFKDFILPD